MQIREYIFDSSEVKKLSDVISYFGCFSTINKSNSPKIVTKDSVDRDMLERVKDDENLDRFSDYIWEMSDPFDKSMGKDDWIVIRILNSEHLKKVLGREATLVYWNKNLEYFTEIKPGIPKNGVTFTEEDIFKSISFIKLNISAVEGGVRNTSLFDILVLAILDFKKVRLQLE